MSGYATGAEAHEADRVSGPHGAGAEANVSVPRQVIDAEATEVTLALVALRDDHVVAERQLRLVVRLRVDADAHLWSEQGGAITAEVRLDTAAGLLHLSMHFSPIGVMASTVAEDARFLRTAADVERLALRLPDGTLTTDQLTLPTELVPGESEVRALELLAEVALLSGARLRVPEALNDALIHELRTVRALLHGRPVQGTWDHGEIRLRPSERNALEDLRLTDTRHQFMVVERLRLSIEEQVVDLGEVRTIYDDAVIDRIVDDDDEISLHLRAHGGAAAVTRTVLANPLDELRPHLILPDEVFDELASILDGSPENTSFRELL